MSFQQGLSGLNAAAKSLDVIGNNIANASTVGFKGSQAQFADVYANSLNGASGTVAGIGTKVAKIAQQFTQGPIESTGNPLDLAINGKGFFRMVRDGAVQLSRNGQFSLNKEGYIVNAQDAQLTGYMANRDGELLTGTPVPLKIDTSDLPPVQTKEVRYTMKLDSNSEVPKAAFDPDNPISMNYSTPIDCYDSLGNKHVVQTYYVKSAPGVWDVYAGSDGVEAMRLDAKQDAFAAAGDPANDAAAIVLAAWSGTLAALDQADLDVSDARDRIAAMDPATQQAEIDALTAATDATEAKATADRARYDDAVNGVTGEIAAVAAAMLLVGSTPASVAEAAAKAVPARPIGRVVFNSIGELDLSRMQLQAPAQNLPFKANIPVYPATGATSPFTVDIKYDNLQQFASNSQPEAGKWFMGESSVTAKTQDGYRAGQLSRFTFGQNGVIRGVYNNGVSHDLGQVVLVNVANPNGLTPLGNNAWTESPASGQLLVGTPDDGSFGVLESSAVESSNVDLTAELVNMITAQRAYQANAQTIKTQDQVMQTLVNLR